MMDGEEVGSAGAPHPRAGALLLELLCATSFLFLSYPTHFLGEGGGK